MCRGESMVCEMLLLHCMKRRESCGAARYLFPRLCVLLCKRLMGRACMFARLVARWCVEVVCCAFSLYVACVGRRGRGAWPVLRSLRAVRGVSSET